ncbi:MULTISPECIES: hypothetical protein [Stenotrophomonas]|uniref:hypothetical protein n=1 Tax=Stenotrophomonas TaxID=40323 RepID=UPI0020C67093|nr:MULTISPECIES: hypothetical protein [Stenotrophomonas]
MNKTTWAMVTFSVGLGLSACGEEADGPTVEQVAKAYEMYMNVNLATELGQRIEVRGWEDFKPGCKSSGPERVKCITGGKVELMGFQGGEQTVPKPVSVPAEFDLEFEKRENTWVPVRAQKK